MYRGVDKNRKLEVEAEAEKLQWKLALNQSKGRKAEKNVVFDSCVYAAKVNSNFKKAL